MLPARYFARFCRNARSPVVLRRLVGGSLIAAYVVVAAGIPLPTVSRPAKSGELFPCATSGCSCDSAEKCWRSCCCHTLAERLAWADQNGVTPPDFALAEAAKAGLDSRGNPLTAKVIRVAVASKPVVAKTCCQSKHTCCESSATTHSSCRSKSDVNKQDESASFIVAFRALGCHGQSLNGLAAVPTLISVELNLSDQLPLVAWLGPHSSAVAGGVAPVPTPPPPERA
jgi:hypothetical protein